MFNATQDRIVITGATGGLGSEIARQLLHIAPASLLGVSVRDPRRAEQLLEGGVRVRHGDFDDPATLDDAFEGAKSLLIISTRGDNERRVVQHRNAIEAAKRAGVQHLYYTSIVQREGSKFLPAEGHLQTEADLAASGLDYTIFRNGQYIENLPLFLGSSIETGELLLPPDGPVAWVARSDLAEGIARVMLTGGRDQESLLLTGPEALEFDDIAAIAGSIVGQPIRRRVVEGAEYAKILVSNGLPKGLATVLVSGFESRASGELALVDPALQEIVGRTLLTVDDVLPELLYEAANARVA
ncbi:MAG TPA: SDR family oxidoreductase [Sphingomicrobium sp.]|nr:SDR family oxidoreductase [Sphingomicrobium sp.]